MILHGQFIKNQYNTPDYIIMISKIIWKLCYIALQESMHAVINADIMEVFCLLKL